MKQPKYRLGELVLYKTTTGWKSKEIIRQMYIKDAVFQDSDWIYDLDSDSDGYSEVKESEIISSLGFPLYAKPKQEESSDYDSTPMIGGLDGNLATPI